MIVEWIIHLGRLGYPVTKNQLIDSVAFLAKNLNKSNNFTDGKPLRRWYDGLMKRHPNISQRLFKRAVQRYHSNQLGLGLTLWSNFF